jgi:hypothetical protein
MRAGAVRCRK